MSAGVLSSLYVTSVVKQRIRDEQHGDMLVLQEDQFFDWVKTNSPATFKSCKEAWDSYRSKVDIATLAAGVAYDTAGFRQFVKEMGGFASAAKIKVKPIVFDNQVYLLVAGNSHVRDATLRGTVFLASEPKVMAFGVTQKAMVTNTLKAAKFNIWFSVAVRIVDFILSDEKTWTWLGVALAVDLAKIGIAGLATYGAGVALKGIGMTVFAIGVGTCLVGIIIAGGLFYLDREFDISGKIIELLYLKIKSGERKEHEAYCLSSRTHSQNGVTFEIWNLTPHIQCTFPVIGIESIFD